MIKKILVSLVLFVVLLEGVLRLLGIGSPVLFRFDPHFEYIHVANQKVSRLGKTIKTNSFSQRNEEPNPKAVHILKIGDSIINGGNRLSNDELAANQITDTLSNLAGYPIQVLNISAGSWGPDNGLEYLKKYGTFDAQAMIMVYSSHDLVDTITQYSPAGDWNYPSENYTLAIGELVEKVILKGPVRKFTYRLNENKVIYGTEYNPAIAGLVELAKEKNMLYFAYLHPDKEEVIAGSYNFQGKRLLEVWDSLGVEVIQGIEYMKPEYYRDHIHLNEEGQIHLAKALLPNTKVWLDHPTFSARNKD